MHLNLYSVTFTKGVESPMFASTGFAASTQDI